MERLIAQSRRLTSVPRSPNGKGTRGANVHIVTISNERFIRTDNNRVRADNLGKLSELPRRAGARW